MASTDSKDREPRPRTTSNMRKSCHFCRSRKIRCSGQSICTACKDRKIDCVYGIEASKGRPKGSSISSASRSAVTKSTVQDRKNVIPATELSIAAAEKEINDVKSVENPNDSNSAPSFTHFDTLMGQSRRSKSVGSPDRTTRKDSGVDGMEATVGIGLEVNFNVNFVDIDTKSSNDYARAYANFAEKSDSYVRAGSIDFDSESSKGSQDDRTLSYDSLLALLAPDIIESLASKIDIVTASPNSQSRFYVNSLESDGTRTMFDPPPTDSDPLDAYDSNQTAQMIEIWFSHHPLSSILSKTLLLRSYRSGTHDKALLSVILGDACITLEEPGAAQRSERFFKWASHLLKDRPPLPASISTSQTLMLLGWRELCLGHGRRTTCLIGYAGRLIIQLQRDLSTIQAVSLGQINGISIATVELEIVWNMYWLSFSLIVWAFIQMEQPLTALLPDKTPTIFPPIDTKSSMILNLDIASNNVSTLLFQKKAMRFLWPISHISSTAAYIYSLHPRTRSTTEKKPPGEWQSQTASQFRAMLSPKEEVMDICQNIRAVLSEALRDLELQESAPSAGIVSMAYLIISLHTLFNHLQPGHFRETPLDPKALETFVSNSRRLLSIFNLYVQAQDGNGEAQGENGLKSSISPLIAVAGLTVCGRILTYIRLRMETGSIADSGILEEKRGVLFSITTELLHFAKEEPSLPAKRLRLVKKDLKQMRQYLNSNVSSDAVLSRVDSSSTFEYEDQSMTGYSPRAQGKMKELLSDSRSSVASSVLSVQTPIRSFSHPIKAFDTYQTMAQPYEPMISMSTTMPMSISEGSETFNSNQFMNSNVWMNVGEPCIAPTIVPPSETANSGGWDPFSDFTFPLFEFGNLPQTMYHQFDANVDLGGIDSNAPQTCDTKSMLPGGAARNSQS